MAITQPPKASSPENEEPKVPLLRCHFRVMMETARGGLPTGQQSVSEMFPPHESQGSSGNWTQGLGTLSPCFTGL